MITFLAGFYVGVALLCAVNIFLAASPALSRRTAALALVWPILLLAVVIGVASGNWRFVGGVLSRVTDRANRAKCRLCNGRGRGPIDPATGQSFLCLCMVPPAIRGAEFDTDDECEDFDR